MMGMLVNIDIDLPVVILLKFCLH